MSERQPIEIIDSNPQSCSVWEKIQADRQEIIRIMLEYAVLRITLRNSLMRAGIYSNPGWLDSDITSAVANKLNVEDTYRETREHIAQRTQASDAEGI